MAVDQEPRHGFKWECKYYYPQQETKNEIRIKAIHDGVDADPALIISFNSQTQRDVVYRNLNKVFDLLEGAGGEYDTFPIGYIEYDMERDFGTGSTKYYTVAILDMREGGKKYINGLEIVFRLLNSVLDDEGLPPLPLYQPLKT